MIVDMKVACAQDVKKMLRRQAKEVVGKRWATKHEYEELTDGVWVEPGVADKENQPKEDGQACECCQEAHS